MKKTNFALLILLVVCVTVAGAYATWNYTTSSNIDAINNTLSVSVADKNVTTVDGGTLSTTGTMTATIDNGGNYKAALVMGGNDIVVNYTAGTNDPDVTAVSMYVKITLTSVAKYNNTEILSVKTATINSNGAVSTWQITPEMVGECLQIADITLDTEAKYDAFKTATDAVETVITIEIGAN